MSKKKKYYWLRLKRDFFKRHDIQIIEAMPNGKDYILFYLKLLCESVDHEGNLRFSDAIPYDDHMLSTITNTNVDIVRTAIKVFSELKMMDILDDGTIYMNGVEKMIGYATQDEHTRESTRLRVQAFRERQKQAQIEDKRYSNVTCNGELEIEIKKEINKKKNNKKEKVRHKYGQYQNVLLSDEDMEKLKTEFPNDWESRIENVSSYCQSHGKSYKDYLATIRNWARKENNGRGSKQHTRRDQAEREKEIDRYLRSDEYLNGEDESPFDMP